MTVSLPPRLDRSFFFWLLATYAVAVLGLALPKMIDGGLTLLLIPPIVWIGLVVTMFRRFGRRAAWSLLGAPVALAWALIAIVLGFLFAVLGGVS
jgi:hypothetical protein